MTTSRLLYDVQELDQQMDEAQKRLSVIHHGLGDREGLSLLEDGVRLAQERLKSLQGEHRDREMSSESTREKIRSVETKLYGGSVKNPRELQDLNNELEALRRDLHGLEDKVLESMVTLEQVQEELEKGRVTLRGDEAAWNESQQSLGLEKDEIEVELKRLKDQRRQMERRIGPQELQLYERLRTSKAGQAVALVERGLCCACSVALPTHQIQRARAGREPVLCGSCGRILCAA